MSESLTTKETFATYSAEQIAIIKSECAAMSADFSQYQIDFVSDLMALTDLLGAMRNVADLGMQADISDSKIQKVLFDTSGGFLVSGVLQQPIFVAVVDDTYYAVSGRHRISALFELTRYGLSMDTLINVVLFRPDSIGLAMSMVLTSNGSRSVTKGETAGFKLAKYGVEPNCNDCLRAARENILSKKDGYSNACWFSYTANEFGERSITTVQGIGGTFYSACVKMHYSFAEICDLMDSMLSSIETACKVSNVTAVQRSSNVVVDSIIAELGLEVQEAPQKKQAKRNAKATLFSRKLG